MMAADVKWSKERGLGLIELLVALAIGLLVTLGVAVFFGNTISSAQDSIKSARIQNDMSNIVDLMAAEIRRSGYWGSGDLSTVEDPNLSVISPTCVVFYYDRNNDGVKDTGSTSGGVVTSIGEFGGFKLLNGDVWTREVCNPASDACMSSCTNTNQIWTRMNDENYTTITALAFDSVGSKCLTLSADTSKNLDFSEVTSGTDFRCPCTNDTGISFYDYPAYGSGSCTGSNIPSTANEDRVISIRQVNIDITGQSSDDALIRATSSATVRVGNNHILCGDSGTGTWATANCN
jgi:type II secretory pathway component PulJ